MADNNSGVTNEGSLFCLQSDPTCANDAAVNALKAIYGDNFISSFLEPGTFPAAAIRSATDLAPILFRGIAVVAGLLAVAIGFCLVFTNLVSSAQDGEAFGKGSKKSVILLRAGFGMAMLMPTPAGYCLAQIVLMFFILWSNGETNQIYRNVVAASAMSNINASMDGTNNVLADNVDVYGLRGVSLMYFKQAYCTNLLNQNYKSSLFNGDGSAAAPLNQIQSVSPSGFKHLDVTSHKIKGTDQFTHNISNLYLDSTFKTGVGAVTTGPFNESGDGNTPPYHVINLVDKDGVLSPANNPICGSVRIYSPEQSSFDSFISKINLYRNSADKISSVFGREVAGTDDVYREIAQASALIALNKKALVLQTTADIAEWMDKANIPYNLSDASQTDALSNVDFTGLKDAVDQVLIKARLDYQLVDQNTNYTALVQTLVNHLTDRGWTYASGIKQRIISAQSELAFATNRPLVTFNQPNLALLQANISDERKDRFNAAVSAMNMIVESTLGNPEYANGVDPELVAATMPTSIDEDTDATKLSGQLQNQYSSLLGEMKRGIVFSILTGKFEAGTPESLTANKLQASWLNADRDVVENIQRTGEYIAILNFRIMASKYALQATGYGLYAATGYSTTLTGMANTVNKFIDNIIVPPLTKISMYLFVLQTYMAVVIPSMPFFFFITAVVAWYIHTLQAMAGLPFWAIMHMIPEKTFAGSQTQGYVTVMALFLRPILTLVGLFSAFILANPILIYVTDAFFAMQENLLSSNGSVGSSIYHIFVEILTFFNWIIVYCTLMLQVCYMIFGLAGTLPDSVLRWMGSTLNGGGWGESNAKGAIDAGAKTSVEGDKTSAKMNAQKNSGKPSNDNSSTPNGGDSGGPGGGRSGGGSTPTNSDNGGVDASNSEKSALSSSGVMNGAGAQLSNSGSGVSSAGHTPSETNKQDFMASGGVIGSDGKALNNSELMALNKTRDPNSATGLKRTMGIAGAVGGSIGAIKGVGQGVQNAIASSEGLKGKEKFMTAVKSFGQSVAGSAKDAASSAANYAGHQHFAKFGGLPVNNGSSTSYTQGGSNPNFGQAYANITGAKK